MNAGDEHAAAADAVRLFVALWPGEAFRRALRAWCGPVGGGGGCRPVAAGRWHLTLHFLGDVPRERVPELRRELRVPWRAFRLFFSHCERWPHGLLVLPPDAPPPAMTHLHEALREALQRAALPTEARPFRPHLTLARRHAGALPQPAVAALAWDVDACALVASAAPQGGGYAVLESWPPV
jgi:2'-5' RNA ligase